MKTLFEGKKLYTVIIALFFVMTFSITFHIIRDRYIHALNNVIHENKLTANLLSTLMYEHQKATVTEMLMSCARHPLFIEAVKKKDLSHVTPHLKSLSENHAEMDALFITDKSGTLWANYPVDSKGFGKNLAYRDWYKGVSRNWRPYISTVFRLIVLEKGLAVAVSVPVLDGKGNIIGILSSAQRIAFLAALIKANTIYPEKNITLLDQEGNIIFSTTFPYQENITKYPDARILEKALAGAGIDMEIVDAKDKGNISYVSIAPVRGIGWSVIVGQEKGAIWKSLYGYSILSAAAGLVIFLFFAVCVFFFRREYKYRKTKDLLRAEEKYRSIFENVVEGIFQTTSEGRFLIVNPSLVRMFGYSSPEELIEIATDVRRQIYVNPDKRDEFIRILQEKGTVTGFEVQLKRKDGSTFWVTTNARCVHDENGKLLYYEGTSEDITARKLQEEALQEKTAAELALLNAVTEALFLIDGDGIVIAANETVAERLGKTADEIIGTNIFSHLPSAIVEKRINIVRKVIETGVPQQLEDVRDGRIIAATIYPVVSSKSDIKNVAVFGEDITEKRKDELELQQNEKRLKALWDIANMTGADSKTLYDHILKGVVTLTESQYGFFGFITENESVMSIYSWSGEAMKDCLVHDKPLVFPISSAGLWGTAIRERKPVIINDYSEEHPDKKGLPDGHAPIRSLVVVPVFQDDRIVTVAAAANKSLPYTEGDVRNIGLFVGNAQVLLEKKSMEEALRESREQFFNAFEYAPIGVALVSPEGRWLKVNQSLCNIVGYSETELLTKTFQDITHPDDLETDLAYVHQMLAGEIFTYRMQKRYYHKSGQTIWVLLTVSMVRGSQGEPLYFISQVEDITASKLAEEKVKASLLEKEMLLREVHHRVKNNLAAIIALLEMQRQTMDDPAAASALKDLGARIKAMALVHERLYQSENLSRIDFRGYIEALVSNLLTSFSPNSDIRCAVTAESITIGLDIAVPCGMMINELITNTIKHAFPDGKPRPGESHCGITISMEYDGTAYTLIVADNGVGLPADFDWETTKSLGLRLVRMLGQHQLQGQVEIDRTTGTRFILSFGNE